MVSARTTLRSHSECGYVIAHMLSVHDLVASNFDAVRHRHYLIEQEVIAAARAASELPDWLARA